MGYSGHAQLLYGMALSDEDYEKYGERNTFFEENAEQYELDYGVVRDSRSVMGVCIIGGALQETEYEHYVKINTNITDQEKQDIETKVRQFCDKYEMEYTGCDWFMTESIR